MCGFVGFTGKLERRKEILNAMMDRIIHRGPDMAGEFFDDDVALGFRRLSIIDLRESANQPMTGDDGNVTVVFNGEIYNFQKLREELTAAGHTFRTMADTEVLVHGWEEWKTALVPRLRGMFAFVIYDKADATLFGARDYFGIKPLYYTRSKDGSLLFGSEIKSFLEHPGFIKEFNENALLPYLTFQYSSQDETFFKGVWKLPPAHTFLWKNGEMTLSSYWDTRFEEERQPFDQTAENLDKVVRESVEAHRIADVKVGTFLSGGIDSSYITACMMPSQTFSVGYEQDKFNETSYAKELSDILGIENVSRTLTAEECFNALPEIQYHMDEPQSNPSSVPLYFLAKLASEHVTVVLSGEGADEIFAGYEWYEETPLMRKYKKLPQCLRIAAAGAAKRLPYFKGHDFMIRSTGRPEDYFIGQALVWEEKDAVRLVKEPYRHAPTIREITGRYYEKVKGKDELTKKQYLDLHLWMPGDILLKADKMSMAHSLELRVPFLDREVMAFAGKLPADYRINPKGSKYALRQAACHTLPPDWVNRKKKGFPVPIRYWLQDEKYAAVVRQAFTSDYATMFFDTAQLTKLLDEHIRGESNNGRRIWTVYVFLVWYKRFFIDENSGASN